MGNTIILTESQVVRLAKCLNESSGEVTYYQFKFPCEHFIESLLKDPNPARANLDKVFSDNGITKEQLEKVLRKHSVLSSKQRISDDQGDDSAHYVRRYIRNSNNIDQKLHDVYDELFSKKENIEECASCGATNCAGVGAGNGLDFPVFQTVRRTFASPFKKKKKHKKK